MALLDTLVRNQIVSYYTKRSQVDSNTVVSLRIRQIGHRTTEGLIKSRLVLEVYSLSPNGGKSTYEDNFRGLEDINEILLMVTMVINES